MDIVFAHVTSYPHFHPHERFPFSIELLFSILLVIVFLIPLGYLLRKKLKRGQDVKYESKIDDSFK